MAYNPVEWNTGDVITAAKLNNMDNGIDANDTFSNNLNDNLQDYFIVRTYTATYSVEASPNYVNITNTMLNRTPIDGYTPVGIVGWYTGNRYVIPLHIKANVETPTPMVVALLNTSNVAVTDATFTIYILYVKNSLKI